METLKMTNPEFIQMDEFKNKQLLSLTINLLLFIRSQVPVTKKLFQSCEHQIAPLCCEDYVALLVCAKIKPAL